MSPQADRSAWPAIRASGRARRSSQSRAGPLRTRSARIRALRRPSETPPRCGQRGVRRPSTPTQARRFPGPRSSVRATSLANVRWRPAEVKPRMRSVDCRMIRRESVASHVPASPSVRSNALRPFAAGRISYYRSHVAVTSTRRPTTATSPFDNHPSAAPAAQSPPPAGHAATASKSPPGRAVHSIPRSVTASIRP